MNAALELVDSRGIDAVTIRAIARLVDAPPMSLYTHFANKSQLLDFVYAEVSRRLYVESGKATWQEELSAFAHHVRQTLLAHPRWTPILSRPAASVPVPARERILKMMVDCGFSPEDALNALSSISVTGLGLALVELTFRDPGGASAFARRFESLRNWTQEEGDLGAQPTTRAAFAQARRFDLDETFTFAIKTLIEGIALTQPARSSARLAE